MRFAPISYTALAISLIATTPAVAQDAAQDSGEIIVTARKRDETSLSVPVVVTAVGGVELERRAVNNLDGLARLVPQLMVGPQGGSVQGGNISIRGIAGPDSNPFADQAVSFNVDGVAIGKATVRRMADTDIQQVEVLKGPQALFYGKNSPAGIVTIRTADPTEDLQAKISAGYEFKAREIRTEGYVSAPLAEGLGIRVAGIFSDMDGYLKNNVPKDAYVYSTSGTRMPDATNWAGRVTLKWEPSDRFDARLKVNYGKLKDRSGPAALTQYYSCPVGGVPQSGAIDDCKMNNTSMAPGNGPIMAQVNPAQFKDGENFLTQKQFLSSLEMNYDLTDELKLTSVTGFYKVKLNQVSNYENDYAIALPSNNFYDNQEFSQELRVASNYDGPLNFSGGVYFSSTKARTGSTTYVYATETSGLAPMAAWGLGFVPLRTPLQINNYDLQQKGKAYSAYLQMTFKPVEKLEINVGGRYSKETKRIPYVLDEAFNGAFNPFGYNPLTQADLVTISPKKRSWNDFSPEVTVSYRPTSNLTLFSSYKHGFLSGGFNSSSVAFRLEPNISYDQQTIKGFEGGVKALVLDNTLRLNLAAYTYKMKGLQLTNFTNATSTIRNAGAAKIEGAEFDFSYKTPLDGLTINGAAAYNKGEYTENLGAPCYNGQTIALGCVGGVQDLGGTPLPRAPKWNLSAGFNYDTLVTETLKFGLSGSAIRSTSYLTDSTSAPQSRQPSYTLLDATARVGDADGAWEVAFIGRNLTNKVYFFASPNVPFTGTPAGGVTGTLGDRYAGGARGRELMVRLSYKFGGK